MPAGRLGLSGLWLAANNRNLKTGACGVYSLIRASGIIKKKKSGAAGSCLGSYLSGSRTVNIVDIPVNTMNERA
jgi:hypothetical protein